MKIFRFFTAIRPTSFRKKKTPEEIKAEKEAYGGRMLK